MLSSFRSMITYRGIVKQEIKLRHVNFKAHRHIDSVRRKNESVFYWMFSDCNSLELITRNFNIYAHTCTIDNRTDNENCRLKYIQKLESSTYEAVYCCQAHLSTGRIFLFIIVLKRIPCRHSSDWKLCRSMDHGKIFLEYKRIWNFSLLRMHQI